MRRHRLEEPPASSRSTWTTGPGSSGRRTLQLQRPRGVQVAGAAAPGELRELAERVPEPRLPFLGACCGVGVLGGLRGGLVDRTYGEPISATRITLTDAGALDPLLGVLPREFDAFSATRGGGDPTAGRRRPAGEQRRVPGAGVPDGAARLRPQFHPGSTSRGCACGSTPIVTTATSSRARQTGSRRWPGPAVHEPPRLLAAFAERYARR